MSRPLRYVPFLLACAHLLFGALPRVCGQEERVVFLGRTSVTGTVTAAFPQEILVRDAEGATHRLLIHGEEAPGVRLKGRERLLTHPAKAKVTGQFRPGDISLGKVRFEARINRQGQTKDAVAELWVVSAGGGVTVKEEPPNRADYALCEIVGAVNRLRNDRLLIRVPKNDFTLNTTLAVGLAKDAVVRFETDDYRKAGAGAKVTSCTAVRTNTGDLVVERIEMEVDAKSLPKPRTEDELEAKFADLSDEPQKPRNVRSARFILYTDISERQAQILLAKLERMVSLLEEYFRKRMTGVVSGFVVRDMENFPASVFPDPEGRMKLLEGAGRCVGKSLGASRSATVYAIDDHGTVQHEATHAYCCLAFGSTGPTWLGEGVAELGQYWKEDSKGVDINSYVVEYIKQAAPRRTLLEIAVPGRVPAGNWQDYAWRWALCHLLSQNPNYAPRFKPLAIALMSKQPSASFESVYGPVSRELAFEYDFFLEHFDNGFRADLCAWQWNRPSRTLRGDGVLKTKVLAQHGWQAASVKLKAGESYEIVGEGKWRVDPEGEQYDADGDAQGRGRLMGCLFADYKLGPPFALGAKATLQAPMDGDLFLRCADEWHQLADNKGEMSVSVRRAAATAE